MYTCTNTHKINNEPVVGLKEYTIESKKKYIVCYTRKLITESDRSKWTDYEIFFDDLKIYEIPHSKDKDEVRNFIFEEYIQEIENKYGCLPTQKIECDYWQNMEGSFWSKEYVDKILIFLCDLTDSKYSKTLFDTFLVKEKCTKKSSNDYFIRYIDKEYNYVQHIEIGKLPYDELTPKQRHRYIALHRQNFKKNHKKIYPNYNKWIMDTLEMSLTKTQVLNKLKELYDCKDLDYEELFNKLFVD